MSPDQPFSPGASSTGRGGAALSLFAFVFFMRAWLIKTWGSPVPFWDEWDSQALGLIRPWLDGTLHWADLFKPHNEHRIVLTRLADLFLFIISGRWNLWWQLLLNATLHATTAATLIYYFWPASKGHGLSLSLLGLALLFAAPSGWQNALWGFQSQVYFCSLFSLLALGGLLLWAPLQRGWWLGWFSALLALFTVGSGVLAAVSALGIEALVLLTVFIGQRTSAMPEINIEKNAFARTTARLVAILVLVALGWALRVEVPQHASLQAHSLAQFSAVFLRCLSWPWVDSTWLWLGLQAPLLWFFVRLLLCRTSPSGVERLILGLGLLAILHAAAVAYSRGAGLFEFRPLSRYQDSLLFSTAANFFVLIIFAAKNRVGRIATLLWAGLLFAGLLTLTTTNLSLHLPFKRAQDNASLEQVRAYLPNHDATVFTADHHLLAAHPDSTVVRCVLDDPQLRAVLPRELFDTTAQPPWLIKFSPWLVLLSAFSLLWIILRYEKTSST